MIRQRSSRAIAVSRKISRSSAAAIRWRPEPRAAPEPSFSATCGTASATLAGALSRSQPIAWPVQPAEPASEKLRSTNGSIRARQPAK